IVLSVLSLACASAPADYVSGHSSTLTGAACNGLIAAIGDAESDVTCFESTDLTTENPATIPPDNSIPGLPPGLFTPRSDLAGPVPPDTTPIFGPVPGLQLAGTTPGGATARWILRLPSQWNGRLVVGPSSGFSSEYAYDRMWSDFVVQLGYAYVGSNKGFYQRYQTTVNDPEGCLVVAPGNPDPPQYFHYSLDSQENPFPEFFEATRAAANVAKIAAAANYGVRPAYTYVVGFSNGGWVARRLLAIAPDEFDGGIDQAGTAWLP